MAPELGGPLHRNQAVMLTVDGLKDNADSTTWWGKKPLYVSFALPGERIRVRIEKVEKTYAAGKCVEAVSASPDRATPPCPVFGRCGGCQVQHMTMVAQHRFKVDRLHALLSQAGFEDVPLLPLKIGPQLGYRNKLQMALEKRWNGIAMGLYARYSQVVVDIDHCPIQNEPINAVLTPIRAFFQTTPDLVIHDAKKGRLGLKHVVIRVGAETGEVMVALVTSAPDFPQSAKWVAALGPQVTSLLLNHNPNPDNVILGSRTQVLAGTERITDRIGGLRFAVSLHSFLQSNAAQTETLYETVRELAGLQSTDTVWDLFCGVGTIGLFLSQDVRQVIGVDIVPEAIADAQRNAIDNGITTIRFVVGDATQIVSQLPAPDVIVMDPPRAGLSESVITTIAGKKPRRVVYVSCNPQTLIRDLGRFQALGYRPQIIQPVDMFAQTTHLEVGAVLTPSHL